MEFINKLIFFASVVVAIIGLVILIVRFTFIRLVSNAAIECITDAVKRFDNGIKHIWITSVITGIPNEAEMTAHVLKQLTRSVTEQAAQIKYRLKMSGAIMVSAPLLMDEGYHPAALAVVAQRLNWLFKETYKEYTSQAQRNRPHLHNSFSFEVVAMDGVCCMMMVNLVIVTPCTIPTFDRTKVMLASAIRRR